MALYDHRDHQTGTAEWFCGGSNEASLRAPSDVCLANLFKSTIPSARPAAVSATIDAAGSVVVDPIVQVAVDWYRNSIQGRNGEAMTMEVFHNPYGRSAWIEFPFYEAELFVMEMHGQAPMAVFSKTEGNSNIQCQ